MKINDVQQKYMFNHEQLWKLLKDTCELADEYEKKHGKDRETAIGFALWEAFEGLDAEMDLFLDNLGELTMQQPIDSNFTLDKDDWLNLMSHE